MAKTGKSFKSLALLCFFFTTICFAEVEFQAGVQTERMGQGENIPLHFTVRTDGMSPRIEKPQFDAPDFDEVNQFNRGTSIESRYINGQFSTTRTEQFTSILLPKKKGNLKIKNIRVTVDGKVYHASDLTVAVSDAPAAVVDDDSDATAPGSGGSPRAQGIAQPDDSVAKPKRGEQLLFLRTEPNKTKAYRGEQIILEYSLFTRTQIGTIQVERYPTASGFLKEDLDLPLLKNNMQFSERNVNGAVFQRATMARYAIFAVRDGKLPLDVFSAKISYRGVRAGSWGTDEDDDPFMLRRFFQNFQMMTETRSSDRREIEIVPLPTQGKPESFRGLVGQFEVAATADKARLKVGEALSVKVKIEGTGHAGSLESLQVVWPEAFEQYENKSQTKYHPNGTSERVFDFLLIPRQAGHFDLPAIEISMFDPSSESYKVKASTPISIDVEPGDGNVTSVPGAGNSSLGTPAKPSAPKLSFEPATGTLEVSPPARRGVFFWLGLVMAGLGIVSLLASLIYAAVKSLRKNKPVTIDAKDYVKQLKQLELEFSKLKILDSTELEARKAIDELGVKLEEIFAGWLRFLFGTSKGSLTRSELEEFLKGRACPDELRVKILAFAEELESVRFMPSQNNAAQNSLLNMVKTLQRLVQ